MASLSRRHALTGAAGLTGAALLGSNPADAASFILASKAATAAKFGTQKPTYWGTRAPATITRFSPASSRGANAVCLTFDACGGSRTAYDSALITTLRRHNVPATLFINRTWATNNPATFRSLLADPLFEIENHGWSHRPLSVTGRPAYGIAGTKNIGEVWDEVAAANWYYATNYGYRTRYMRGGTAYTDDVASAAARYMGQPLAGFSVEIDDGATLSAGQVYARMLTMKPGDIGLAHFNRPTSGNAAGVARAIPVLKARGLVFKRMKDVL